MNEKLDIDELMKLLAASGLHAIIIDEDTTFEDIVNSLKKENKELKDETS